MRITKTAPRRSPAGTIACAIAAIAASLAFAVAPAARAADPNALWHIVHDLCVPNMRAAGDPTPCVAVDLAGGYAVLKDIRGATQLLIIPTDKLTGIESPLLLAPDAPNYFAEAWAARGLFEKRAGRAVPPEDIGLAVNSASGRSQNQLHIHLDCVRPDVRAALAARLGRIGPGWSRLTLPPVGHVYMVRRLDGTDLAGRNPFKLLAASVPGARADMGAWTLAVIGETFAHGKAGFVLLAEHADPASGDVGAAEELQDHGCAVLAPDGAPAAPAASAP